MDNIKMTDSLRMDILAQINDSIILDNIIEQINEVYNKDIDKKNVNFIEYFNNRYNAVMELAEKENDDKLIMLARESKSRFFDVVLKTLGDIYGFNIDFRDNLMENEIYEVIHAIYRFFVLEIYDNLVDYATNIIIFSKHNIIEQYKDVKHDTLLDAMIKEIGEDNAKVIYFLGNTLETISCDNLYEFTGRVCMLDPDEYTNILIKSVFSELDTYVDTFIEVGKCNFLTNNMKSNYKLRQGIENKVLNILKRGEI